MKPLALALLTALCLLLPRAAAALFARPLPVPESYVVEVEEIELEKGAPPNGGA